ncbi:hypothetical protein GGI05_001287, partial [Coemansia sp. RSA 2603]
MTTDSKSINSTVSSNSSSVSGTATPAKQTQGSQPGLASFLKAILSFTGDLSSLTCP